MPTNKDSLKGFVDFNNTSQHAADSVMNRYFVGFPYSLSSQNEEYVSGIEDITDLVRNGYSSLYSRDGMPGYSFYADGSGRVYRVSDAENINTSGMSPLSYSDMRKMLPKREYIGGKDYRFKTAQRIPGFLDKIKERAESYGIDPNLVLNRILHEGWIDQQVINYNGLDASQQGGYWNGLWDAPVSGYGSFGLDYAGNNLMNGVYELKDPDVSWRDAEFTDYEGGNGFRVGTSLEADNLSSAIEILAAELAYRQGEVAKKYGKKGSDLNVWTNAAFNMGLNHKDLKNDDWVRSQYTYPDYYGQMETQKKLGGIIQRFGADKLQQYFASGGSIHIKPSHRGRLTELKERTGKSEAELYSDGNPAHKKMVVFARNARKWEHADGGLIERYGSRAVRDALQKMRGNHRYDGESEQTGQMNTIASKPWMQNSYLKLPEGKPSVATNFVEESAPLVQLDDDAIYLGDIEPVIFVSDRMRPIGERPKINMDDAVQLSETVDSSNPNIMLRAVPSDLNSVTRDSLDREVLVRAGIKGESIKDTSLNMLASLDNDVRKNVEAELVSQGWYDADASQILSRIKNRSDEAYRLQEHLRDLGYDLGRYGKNKDGVDGMIGRMTKSAIDKYVKEHKADALRDIASFGAFSDSQTADALARRVQYMQAHDKPSDEKSTKIEDSLLGEQNIGTQYDSQFDDYRVGGFDASNIYNVPVEEYGRASSPLSFKSFPKTCNTNECASAVTNFFLSNFGGDFIDKYNLRGDAWTMGDNIVRAGGKRIFNLFDDAGAPRENNKNVTINYVRQRAKDPEYKKMLSEGIGVGDIVELLYPNSPNFKKAYEESNGHNQNTHIGMVVEKDGELYVFDNSGGTYHHAKLSDVINGKEGRGVLITGAVSVNDGKDWRFGHNNESALYRADMSELGITPNEDYNKKVKDENGVGIKYHNYNNEAAYREMASLKRNSGELMSSYGLNAEEFNKLAALTHAASMMETRNGSIAEGRKFRAESGNISFGEGVGPLLQQFGRYTLPNMSESISSFIRGAEQNAQKRNGEDTTTASVLDKIPVVRKAFKPVSRGLTNVKADYHFTRDEQASLPVQGNYVEQPESSAIMGFSVLAKNYNHIKERLAGTKLGENKELLYTLTALAHNQGLNNIDTNIARYLSSGDEEELLQYMHREKEYRDALKKKDKKKAEYYNGPRYSRLMMDFTNYNKYNLVI